MQAQKSWFANFIREVVLNTNQRLDVEGLKKIFQDFLYSEAHFGMCTWNYGLGSSNVTQ
jgi:hypothetical protein